MVPLLEVVQTYVRLVALEVVQIHALITPNFPFGSNREITGEYLKKIDVGHKPNLMLRLLPNFINGRSLSVRHFFNKREKIKIKTIFHTITTSGGTLHYT